MHFCVWISKKKRTYIHTLTCFVHINGIVDKHKQNGFGSWVFHIQTRSMQLVFADNVLLVDRILTELLQTFNSAWRLGSVAKSWEVYHPIRKTLRYLPQTKSTSWYTYYHLNIMFDVYISRKSTVRLPKYPCGNAIVKHIGKSLFWVEYWKWWATLSVTSVL